MGEDGVIHPATVPYHLLMISRLNLGHRKEGNVMKLASVSLNPAGMLRARLQRWERAAAFPAQGYWGMFLW